MKHCIQDLLTENGECRSVFSRLYVHHSMGNKIYDSCTIEQVNFYKTNCVDINNVCNIHTGTKSFVTTKDINESLIKCMFVNEIELLNTFFHYGASCIEDQEISDRYHAMKDYAMSGNCPKQFNDLIDLSGGLKTKTYCKQYVEVYEEYCG